VKGKKKWLIAVAVLLGIAVMGFAVFRAVSDPGQKGKAIQTAKVQQMDMEAKVTTTGKIQSQVSRTVSSDLAGKISEVLVSSGDTVKAGQVLARLDTNDLIYKIQSKELQIKSEQLKLAVAVQNHGKTQKAQMDIAIRAEESARRDLESNQALFNSGGISESDLRGFQNKYDQAYSARVAAQNTYDSGEDIQVSQTQIQILQQELEQLRTDQARSLLKSPIDGVVTEVNIKSQDTIAENTALIVVEDLTKMEAVVKISEFDIGKLQVGQTATIKASGLKNQILQGRVSKIAPSAKVQTSGQSNETTIEVHVEVLDPAPGLKSNFSADVIIKSDSHKNALTLPYEALYVNKDGVKKVFVVEKGVLKEKKVTTGIEGDLDIEVQFDGVKKGTEVLMNPNDTYKDGDKVKTLPEAKDGGKQS